MNVCVAVIERNEKLYIDRNLQSIIAASNYAKLKYSLPIVIYIIDGGSTDGTVEVIKERYSLSNIKLMFDKGKGLGAAHNFALINLNCNIIFFTFGDEIVSKEWIVSALKWFKYKKTAAVFGPVYLLRSQRLLERYADWKLQKYFSRLIPGQHASYVAATNLAIRRDVALKIGGFREDLIDADDSEFTFRLSRAGYKIIYEPKMVVYHQKAEEAKLKTLIRATMLVAFGYGQVATIHGLNWHPVCKIYISFLPSFISWIILTMIYPSIGLLLMGVALTSILGYFTYQAISSRSIIPLLGILIEPLRLFFASLSFIMGYVYQLTLYRHKRISNIIRKIFDYIRLKVGH